ncbi:hypothetical protein RN001_008815 [Aquatica leii]|uniref:Uncharacterized protein n=1 Tax=Aquatica leii TaxID=1421715 RepID=A0AAN7PXR7_9COLE|nr:hypothetical protein RN001_008815 [Aquatica leii]
MRDRAAVENKEKKSKKAHEVVQEQKHSEPPSDDTEEEFYVSAVKKSNGREKEIALRRKSNEIAWIKKIQIYDTMVDVKLDTGAEKHALVAVSIETASISNLARSRKSEPGTRSTAVSGRRGAENDACNAIPRNAMLRSVTLLACTFVITFKLVLLVPITHYTYYRGGERLNLTKILHSHNSSYGFRIFPHA